MIPIQTKEKEMTMNRNEIDYWYEFDTDHTIYPTCQWYQVAYTCAICEAEVYTNIVHASGKQYHDVCYNRLLAYRQRIEQRYERLLNAADRLSTEGQALRERSNHYAEIMNGQPVLIGHHTEKRHRSMSDKM